MTPISIEELRKASFTMTLHLSMDHCHVSVWESRDVPGLTVTKRSPRGRSKEKASRSFHVTGVGEEFTDLQLAVDALNKLRLNAVRDREWEEADPAKAVQP